MSYTPSLTLFRNSLGENHSQSKCDEGPSCPVGFANVARSYAISRQLGPILKGAEGEPHLPEFEDILERAGEPGGYLYTYEALPELSSGSPPNGADLERYPWQECFVILTPEDPSAGSHPPQTGGLRALLERVATQQQ